MAETSTALSLPSSMDPGDSRKSRRRTIPKVPSLPKLHDRAPLVTTALSQSIFQSTASHVHDFDLSRPIEDESFTKYNSLHDPHTKAYFHRPLMIRKLQSNGFITENMKVVCSLKEYNLYREFMESESMKLRKTQEQEQAQKPELNVKKLRSVDTAREEKRNQLFAEQESKLASRQRKMRRVQRREQQERLKTMEEKKLMRERNEIRQEAEREHRQLSRLQREHQEAVVKRQQLHSSENQMLVRLLHLQHSRQAHRLQQIQELESKWQAYDEHVCKMREEEEECKARAKEEKERKRKRRERVISFWQAKSEERRKKMHEETVHQVEELKKQADQQEKIWRDKKEHEVVVWREKIHREQEHWQHHIDHQMEACKTKHQKQIDSLLHNAYLPKCAKSASKQHVGSTVSKMSSADAGSTVSKMSSADVVHGKKEDRPGFKKSTMDPHTPKKKGVRFQQTASFHIIEEYDTDFNEDLDSIQARDGNELSEEHSVVKDEAEAREDKDEETQEANTETVNNESLDEASGLDGTALHSETEDSVVEDEAEENNDTTVEAVHSQIMN